MNKQQRIVALVRNAYEQAHERHKHAVAEQAATISGANAWDQYNPDDGIGGFSQNPYNIARMDKRELECRNHLDNMREAYEYAVDTFLKDQS